MAMPSGRFFGWVIGGALPAALAADWLTSAWDQNSGMRFATPGTVAAEEAASAWILDLLGLPAGADVGFVTGGTMANFTGLAAARQQALDAVGWDLDRLGLTGAQGCGCSRVPTGTAPSTWPCATSGSAPPRSSPPTTRGACGSTPLRRRWSRPTDR